MVFNGVKKWIILCGVSFSCCLGADSEYWNDFEREHGRSGITLMQHIETLSQINDESIEVKRRKKDALLYFFATGGKYGFRREPITPSEHDILIKAWISTVVFHYYGEEGRERPVLDLGTERKRYGLGIEKRIIQSHIAYAQAIAGHIITLAWYGQRLTALRGSTPSGLTREVFEAIVQSDLVNTTFEAFRKCYIMPLSRLPCTINDYQLIEKYKEWFDFMTIHKILGFFRFGISLNGNDIRQIQTILEEVLNKVKIDLPQHISQTSGKQLRKIKLSNGSTIVRTDDGRISTDLFGGTVVVRSLNINGFILDASWSDEKIIAALRTQGIIAAVED